jgi:Lon protease-like protein
MMLQEITIPLFPLGLVLMPQLLLPLHIFEDRYKLMISECLNAHKEFGIVFFNGNEICNIGCTTRILRVLKRYDDGRMDIGTKGDKRFIIHELHEEKPYLQARVEYFDDVIEPEKDELRGLAQKGISLLKQLDKLSHNQDTYRDVDIGDLKSISFLIAGSEGFTYEEKQKFLEMTSTYQRLNKAVASLENLIQRMKLTAKIKKIIEGNGQISESLEDQHTVH